MKADEVYPLRPSEFALLMLDASAMPPRQRARSQMPDVAGLDVQNRVLEKLIERDPESDQMEESLWDIVSALGEPSGPGRAVARSILEGWSMACLSSAFLAHLRQEAARANERTGHGSDGISR